MPDPTNGVIVPSPDTITVNSNAAIAYLLGSGTVVMGANTALNILDPAGATGTYQLGTLDTSAISNTVIYSGNAFWAKHQNYDNLVFSNTVITNANSFYNGTVNAQDPAAAMTIAGDMTVIGDMLVQEGADFTINGNLFLGSNSVWDCSSFNLTVGGDTTIGGKMWDLNGALGKNDFRGNVTVISNSVGGTLPGLANGLWNITDVTNWNVGGNLTITNQGLILGKAYGSINFNGTNNTISGQPFTIPTMVVNGTYTIGATITLTNQTPTLSGTLVFDLANTNQIFLDPIYTTNPMTLYYSGNLDVINSGPAPSSGASYLFFNATNYGGAFTSESFPPLPAGLNWVDNLTTSGSIMVTGTASSPPEITQWHYNPVTRQFTLTWTSVSSALYTVRETPGLNSPSSTILPKQHSIGRKRHDCHRYDAKWHGGFFTGVSAVKRSGLWGELKLKLAIRAGELCSPAFNCKFICYEIGKEFIGTFNRFVCSWGDRLCACPIKARDGSLYAMVRIPAL